MLIWNSNHDLRLIGTATAGLESSKKVCMARRAPCSFTIGCLSCGLKPSVFKQDSVGINKAVFCKFEEIQMFLVSGLSQTVNV